MAAGEDPSDETLIVRIVSGDRDAFAALYRRHRADVYRFAMHISGSRPVAEDVTQDVFMAVIHDAGRYRPERAAVLLWLLGIARNHVRRALKQRPTVTLPDDESAAGRTLVVEPDPLAGLARRQHVLALRRAVLELPVKYREVVVLCDLQELTYDDAATALGCAIGTVRSRLHRGRALLASRLRGTDPPLFRTPVARGML
jgi:RNA polymerase sigma-70 factor (ECF subfamily)